MNLVEIPGAYCRHEVEVMPSISTRRFARLHLKRPAGVVVSDGNDSEGPCKGRSSPNSNTSAEKRIVCEPRLIGELRAHIKFGAIERNDIVSHFVSGGVGTGCKAMCTKPVF